MKAILILLLSATALSAQTIITQERKDAYGRTISTVWDSEGRYVGKAYTSKPDAFGRTTTKIWSKKGKHIATGTTRKPDSFGRRITTWLKGRRK